MSNVPQQKLKGIVSISSDDFAMTSNKSTIKQQKNENNYNNKNINMTEPNKPTIQETQKKKKIKPFSYSSSSSASKSIQLPDTFFEQILNCEFKLKEKFDLKTFYELINLYNSAIGFYESIKDPRFVTYNQSLNLLFSMPEVKKFMEGKKSLTKDEKKSELEKKMLQSEKKITEEKVKKIY